MTMFIHFFCFCPLSLTIKLNFNISKVAYLTKIFQESQMPGGLPGGGGWAVLELTGT